MKDRNEPLQADQENLKRQNEYLRSEQNKIKQLNEYLQAEQQKIKLINKDLQVEQEKIRRANENLLADQEKIKELNEQERQNASVLYRRDNPAVQNKIRELARLFMPVGVKSLQRIRVGRMGDGGYVMIDDFSDARVALSFGIGDDVSWDLDIANLGIKVVQYDHSVDSSPQPHKNFVFHKKKIAAEKSADSESLTSVLEAYGAPGRSNILKMDIEGYEYGVFEAAKPEELDRFSQIVCEFHDFQEVYNPEWYDRALGDMVKLRSLFEVVHIHGANTGRLAVLSNMPFPTSFEVTFLNKANHQFEPIEQIYPTELDAAADPNYADIYLGSFKF